MMQRISARAGLRYLLRFFLGVYAISLAPSFMDEAKAERALPLHIFVGSDLGYGSVSPYAAPEGDRNGVQFDIKGLGSVYFAKKLIFDLGGGWQFNKRSGENAPGG